MKKVYAITGAGGYLGSKISYYLKNLGHDVLELRRDIPKERRSDNKIIKYNLNNKIDENLFNNVDVLVHCAYDFNPIRWQNIKKINVDGTVKLIRLAKKEKVKKIIYISSMSAYPNCASLYGKAKNLIENELKNMEVIILKPGLIYGRELGGMMGALNKLVNKLKIIPLPNGGKQVFYLSHYEDLCILINNLVLEKIPYLNNPIIVANSKKYFFIDILKKLGKKNNKKNIFLSVNPNFIYYPLRIMELLGLKLGFKSDSFISLINQDKYPNFKKQVKINYLFRDFDI